LPFYGNDGGCANAQSTDARHPKSIFVYGEQWIVTVGDLSIVSTADVTTLSQLRTALFAIIVLTVVLVFINVWITARLMFIKEHDLVLTTGC